MRKENIKLSITILLIVVFSLSVTYAWMELTANNSTSQNQSGCFVVNYSGQVINNQSLKSTTNYLEGASSNIILSKNSNCKIYNEASIYIHTNSDETTLYNSEPEQNVLSKGALKYKLVRVEGEGQTATETEISTGSITTVGDTLLNDTNNGQDQTKKITLTNTNTTYKVYLWIDPLVSKGTYNDKTYSGYLYASSTQSSTIKE